MASFVKTPDNDVAAYQPPSEGPFKCDNCEYFTAPNSCNKSEVVKELGKGNGNGLAEVEPEGCCNFYSKRNESTMPISEYYKGSGKKVMSSMAKQYGSKKGKQVFYATANASKGKDLVGPSSKLKKQKGM